MNVAFLDTETTGLDPRRHEVWEFCAIIRDPEQGREGDTTHLFQIAVDLDTADDVALTIGRYQERAEPYPIGQTEAAWSIHTILKDCVIVGANPTFDVGFLTALLQRHGLDLPWHYRPICVEAVAYGFMQGFAQAQFGAVITDFALPWSATDLIGPFVDRENYPKHTALGDAEWVRDAWDAVHTIAEHVRI